VPKATPKALDGRGIGGALEEGGREGGDGVRRAYLFFFKGS